jgi:hypothetical protein
LKRNIKTLYSIFCFLSTSIILHSPTAWANDTLVTLGAGGLAPSKSSKIVMESEDLKISLHQITIKYVFRNTSTHDVDTIIAFPLPQLDGSAVYNEPLNLPSKNHDNFLDFNVMSDGKNIPVKMESRAFLDGKEITSHLKEIGMPSSVLLDPLNTALLKLTPEQRTKLEAEKLIVAGDFHPPLTSASEHGWWATWSMHVQFYWSQYFPAGKTIELVQTYRPVIGGSYIPAGGDGTEIAAQHCANSATLKEIKTLIVKSPAKKDGDIAFYAKDIQYILTTANNWKGPIQKFNLTIETDRPEDILLSCMAGLKKIAPARYALSLINFHPDRELDLTILQARK